MTGIIEQLESRLLINNNTCKDTMEQYIPARNLCACKFIFKSEGKIKVFSDLQRLNL